MLTIAIASQKGGVGKTCTCVNLGSGLQQQKVKVALVDMDAQGSATYALGLVPGKQPGFDRWLEGEEVLRTDTAVPLIPGGTDTAYVKWDSPEILRKAISKLDCDLVLLDCPPSLVPATVAALVVADRVIVPVLADPLQLFNDSLKESVAPEPSDDAPHEDSRIKENESKIKIHESGKNNQESKIRNQDSGRRNLESEETKAAPSSLYPLSVRIPEPLNDTLDGAVKQTRRSMGRKIRKEVLVSLAIEAMLQRVETAGGWRAIASEEELRELLGLENE